VSGPLPKPAALRQRRNKAPTRAVLTGAVKVRVPSLPKDQHWHSLTEQWWADIWASPMAGEYLAVDVHGLLRLAVLIDRFWLSPSTKLSTEIRHGQAAYGLSPLSRRRLEWIIERVEDKKPRPRPRPKSLESDPRHVLELLK